MNKKEPAAKAAGSKTTPKTFNEKND